MIKLLYSKSCNYPPLTHLTTNPLHTVSRFGDLLTTSKQCSNRGDFILKFKEKPQELGLGKTRGETIFLCASQIFQRGDKLSILGWLRAKLEGSQSKTEHIRSFHLCMAQFSQQTQPTYCIVLNYFLFNVFLYEN